MKSALTRRVARARRGFTGFTLLELLLAVGLFTILLFALMRLVQTSTTIWERTDESRELSEMSNAVMDMLAADVHALEAGKRGDMLADWRKFDLDRDGVDGAPAQRLRLVRQVGAPDLQRLAGAGGVAPETFERGLVEVGWALLPGVVGSGSTVEPDERAIGTLVRGERLVGDADSLSFFDPAFFAASGKPVPGSLYEITGGVLWFEAWFATQTTLVHDGWTLGDELAHCAASWDAWNRARPDPEVSILNHPAPGMPRAKDVPLLPRRVRLELELERPRDLRHRTRLATPASVGDATLLVRDGRDLPAVGGMILVDDEWMGVTALNGERVTVERGRRGTRATTHAADARVHYGWRAVREIPVDMLREDWDL